MNLKKIQLLIMVFLVSIILAVYGNDGLTSEPLATDYSNPEHWLSLPAAADKEVDIFYLYPTAWQKVNADEPNICEIDNPSMLIGAKAAFARQATAFETIGNIYTPYYRQADAAYCLSLPLTEQDKTIGGLPTLDVFAAFDYYIKHYNKGRPFILAGHSQGSNVLIYLLSAYMKENPQVYDRMIAAYVIGYSVTEDYLAKNPHLKFADGPDDTGVIISYNTEAPTVVGNNPVVLPGALVINPITWTREETLATTSESLGSFLPDPVSKAFSRVPQYADARIDKTKGVLICSTADVDKLSPGNQVFGRGVFHSYDYLFYYYNIRANAENRVNKYLGNSAANPNTTVTSDFPVVVFSDVHFNPFDDPLSFPALVSADASQWAGIFKTSSLIAPSAWGSDTNYPLLVLALSSIRQNLGVSPLIIYTGDILGHNFPQLFYHYLNGTLKPRDAADLAAMKACTDQTVAFFMQQVRSSVGDIPVMFAVGNSDSYSGYGPSYPDTSFLPNNAELFYTKFLNGSVDHQEFLTTFQSGGYYSAEPPGSNMMVIGLNTIIFSPSGHR